MENNNLDDFFNEKLNDFDSANDGWDKLGKAPFESIQPNFPKYPKSIWGTPMSILTGVMGVALTALVIYTFYLKNEIKTLQEHLITENTINENTNSSTVSGISQVSKNKTEVTNNQSIEIAKDNENNLLENSESVTLFNPKNENNNNSLIQKEQKAREQQTKQESVKKEERLSNIDKEKIKQQITEKSKEGVITPDLTQSLGEKNDDKTSSVQRNNNQNLSKSTVFEIENLNLLTSIPVKELAVKPYLFSALKVVHDNSSSQRTPLKKSSFRSKLGAFSLGYEYGFMNMIIPYDVELQGANNLSTRDELNSARSHTHGLMLGYTWGSSWRILTGIRWSESRLRKEINANSIYNSTNEYMLNNGVIGNDLTIEKFSPLTNQQINFTLEFPENQRLNDGEVILVEVFEKQSIEQLQIPLAVEYLFGKKKLQWFTQLGVKLNFMEIKTSERTISVQDFNQEMLAVSNISIEKSRIEERSIGVLGSIGASYELTPHWSIRTTFVYQHNFDNNLKQERGNPDFITEQAIRLGVNYQF